MSAQCGIRSPVERQTAIEIQLKVFTTANDKDRRHRISQFVKDKGQIVVTVA
jgi:hypothetical protein